MKSRQLTLSVVVLMLLSTVALAQSDAQKSQAQKSFNTLKTLAGNWTGPATLNPPQPDMADGTPMQLSLRVTSRGNALVHEMKEAGKPDDPSHYDHPLTMLYLDSDRLYLTH